ncbi:Uncharacterized conserved protein, DUF983 family [Sphingopyxis sp. YR583]|jgi:uncharacterized protein (DUF983 family)|uniref:DUF983 domain-containing protein n=1 Tax=Sphingopyxis sp. YR583 TaxID=1881047 RepID=UPI0008A7D3A1|nr:DUF983 domain-containing protein [Sphingopyxis sp. YR583]SEH20251.1 Uncharacterized conserved protein, DUF983 family [Sphingopyxis sp. YR583]
MSGAAGAHLSPRTKLPAGDNIQKGQPPVWRAALFGLCPECGGKTLFDGPVKFHAACKDCRLDYGRYNVGDGPAAFLTLIIGALLIAIALTLDAVVRPPLWVHVILWVPLTAAAVVYGLRVGKGALLASEHQRQAAEGRKVDKND